MRRESQKTFEKKTKMRILNSLIVPKILKKGGTLWDFLTFFLLQNIKKLKGGLFGDIWKISKKSLTKPKSLIVPKKVRNLCFGILVKKLAHTHGFEHETSGLKSKHLTTRPRTRETCELPREIRELSRGKKKHPHFPITLAYRKCNYQGSIVLSGYFLKRYFSNLVPFWENDGYSNDHILNQC